MYTAVLNMSLTDHRVIQRDSPNNMCWYIVFQRVLKNHTESRHRKKVSTGK